MLACTQPVHAAVSPLLKVHFIDVGQADSTLVQLPNKQTMLIDAGNNDDGPAVVSYLKKQGVKRIDFLIGTHPHEDHIGGMDNVIKSFPVGKLYLPNTITTTETYKDVLLAAKAKKLKLITGSAGMKLVDQKNLKVAILAPVGPYHDEINDWSIVTRVQYGSNSFLFAGDAESKSENEMLINRPTLKSVVQKVGHHGSYSSTSAGFLKAVAPQYAVITVGKGNDYGHPHQSTLDKLTAAKIKTYRTDLNGTIVATSDGKSIKLVTLKNALQPRAPTVVPKTTVQPTTPVVTPVPVVAPAPRSSSNETVYITKTGSKYHADGCRYLSRSQIPISKSDAIAQGYGPCSVCNP